MQVVLQSPCC